MIPGSQANSLSYNPGSQVPRLSFSDALMGTFHYSSWIQEVRKGHQILHTSIQLYKIETILQFLGTESFRKYFHIIRAVISNKVVLSNDIWSTILFVLLV